MIWTEFYYYDGETRLWPVILIAASTDVSRIEMGRNYDYPTGRRVKLMIHVDYYWSLWTTFLAIDAYKTGKLQDALRALCSQRYMIIALVIMPLLFHLANSLQSVHILCLVAMANHAHCHNAIFSRYMIA